MRKSRFFAPTILALVAVSAANAQCNRGRSGGGGTSARTLSPITLTGLSSPLASFNPINSSPGATFLAAQYQTRLAQQQYWLAQQQRYLQMMAQRQQNLERQIEVLRGDTSAKAAEPLTRDKGRPRRERIRQQNAEKAFQLAARAEADGRSSTARTNYRKVVRILGEDSDLGRRASDALARLTPKERVGPTSLAAAVR